MIFTPAELKAHLLCWPAFLPQIVGEVIPEVPDTTNVSAKEYCLRNVYVFHYMNLQKYLNF